MLIDSHCHLNFDAFDADREALFERAAAAEVRYFINPAVDLESGLVAQRLAASVPNVFAAAGIHPNSTAAFSAADLEQIEQQARSSAKVVAIGEIGLDYHWDDSPKATQRQAFEAQLTLAAALRLPVIIHNRDASDDVIAVLRAWVATLPPEQQARPGVLHSFSAPAAIADQALELGFYFGFSGPITYKNADALRSIAARLPADRLLVETDSPFLTPQAHRGQRNEPAYVRLVAERLATLRVTSLAEIATQTTDNAIRLFALPITSA